MTTRVLAFLALVAIAAARMAYELPDGTSAILRAPLSTSFSCNDLPYGYYADIENNCQIFHVCFPITDEEGTVIETAHFTFACGNQTVFNQETLTCSFADQAYPCEDSADLYEISNADFGKVVTVQSVEDVEEE